MVKVRDAGVKLTCRDCGRQFLFTEGEQEFYERMGFRPAEMVASAPDGSARQMYRRLFE